MLVMSHQQHNQYQQEKKQTYVMVQYMSLSSGTGGQYGDAYRGMHQFVPPPAVIGRCPKLTRYKMFGFIAVILLSLLLLTFMAARTSGGPFLRGDDHSFPGLLVGSGPAASPMCNLRIPADNSLAGGADGADSGLDGTAAKSSDALDNLSEFMVEVPLFESSI